LQLLISFSDQDFFVLVIAHEAMTSKRRGHRTLAWVLSRIDQSVGRELEGRVLGDADVDLKTLVEMLVAAS
jgi:hypothetical protein